MDKKDNLDAKDEMDNMNENVNENVPESTDESIIDNNDNNEELHQLEALKKELDDKAKQCSEYLNTLQRTAAEFDNYKKRSLKEKEALYSDAVSDVIAALLPVVDNVDRAVKACSESDDLQVLKEGIILVSRQFMDSLKKINVDEIQCVNQNFDPQLHNAVMHIEDEGIGQNIIVEEFQKGYVYKDKVIRHSMVKVAN